MPSASTLCIRIIGYILIILPTKMNLLHLFVLVFLVNMFLLASYIFFFRAWIFRVNPQSMNLQSEPKGKKVSLISSRFHLNDT